MSQTLPDSLLQAITLRRELMKAAVAVEKLRRRVLVMRERLEAAELALSDAKRHLRLLTEHATAPEPSRSTPDEGNI